MAETLRLYIRPKTVDDALSALSTHQAQILSGGTDFFPALGDRAIRGTVVDISALRALRGITNNPDHTRIGALATWTEIIQTRLPRCFDGLKDAAREIGAIQIQNRGTIAGNLCNASPAADGVPPLLALDAEVEIASRAGTRRMPLAAFITGNRRTMLMPGELVVAIHVPEPAHPAKSAFLKLG